MAVQKFDFKSVLCKRLLPGGGDPLARGQGTPFTLYHARDTKEVFMSDANGNLINLGSLIPSALNGSIPLAFPAQGCAGNDGAVGAMGQRGPTGPAGRDGINGRDGDNGRDSQVPGPKGERGPQGIPGPKGDTGATGAQGPIGLTGATGAQGPQGELLIPTETEIGAALEVLRQQRAKFIAALRQRIADAESIRHRVPQHATLIKSTALNIAAEAGISSGELK